jgi:hypothetical protein
MPIRTPNRVNPRVERVAKPYRFSYVPQEGKDLSKMMTILQSKSNLSETRSNESKNGFFPRRFHWVFIQVSNHAALSVSFSLAVGCKMNAPRMPTSCGIIWAPSSSLNSSPQWGQTCSSFGPKDSPLIGCKILKNMRRDVFTRESS